MKVKVENITGGVLPNNIVYLNALDSLGYPQRIFYNAVFNKSSDAFHFLADIADSREVPDYRKEGYEDLIELWCDNASQIIDEYNLNLLEKPLQPTH